MKKIKLLLCFILMMSFNFKVEAKNVEVTTSLLDNIYSNREINSITYWGKFGYIYVDGKIGYCIDPTHIISSSIYTSSTDFSLLNISEEKLSKIEDYAYYGYGYENHVSTEFYMATQSLIWEALDNYNVYFTTKANRTGDVIDITNYKKEILNTISKNKIPQIAEKLSGKIGEKFIIDENTSFKDYELENSDNQVKIVDGKLEIKFLNEGTKEYTLRKRVRDNSVSILFQAPNSQTVSLLGTTNQNKIKFTVTSIPLKKALLRIYKKDKLTNNLVNGITSFKIKNLITNEYVKNNDNDIFKTDEFGYLCLNFELIEGKYQIEEIEAPYGYLLNTNKLNFIIDNSVKLVDNKYLDLNYFDMPVMATLKIIKKDSITGNFLEGAKFEVYDDNGNFIESVITDNNGLAIVSNLRYGKYYINEIEAPAGYLIDSDKKIIEINNENVEFLFLNEQIDVPNTSANRNCFFYVGGTIITSLGMFIIRLLKK